MPVSPIADEILRYLNTGETDALYQAWPGNNIVERARRAHDDLRGALLEAVQKRTSGRTPPALPQLEPVAFTQAKVEPMIRGLFPRAEQAVVLEMLAHSVVFLTDANIPAILTESGFHDTAWDIANLYLGSVNAELLSDEAPALVGLSLETTCYVSCAYFTEEDPFADFVVHEASHIFHNVKRASLGLPSTRSREWLLDIDFRKRETFAYACEAFSRIIARAKSPVERGSLAQEYGQQARVCDERVDPSELANIVQEAAEARNGWKVILSRCAPEHTRTRR